MKKYLLLAILFTAGILSQSKAQTTSAAVYALPRTVVKVDVSAQKTEVQAGPYARFAQKYLGITVPLFDKVVYTLLAAEVAPFEENDPAHVYPMENIERTLLQKTPEGFRSNQAKGVAPMPARFAFNDLGIEPLITTRTISSFTNVPSDTGTMVIPIDKQEVVSRSLEEMAELAAQTIFKLRKRRFELVTGEIGENVFGAGLQAALDEIKRLEEEYIALFAGKQNTTIETRTFEVVPDGEKNNLIVCRFSPNKGIVDINDLSGRPVMLELKPEGKVAQMAEVTKSSKDSRPMIYHRIADVVEVKVIDNNSNRQVLCTERIPIYQYGKIIEVAIPNSK
ncbi:MAG: DUF4831 family protein [Rikenellaceae bacterium]|nr:DUF4831 family protein [Rikenellaceae bacterium]